MDPNANLKEQGELIGKKKYADKARLQELREALAEWLNRGGFAPDWSAYPRTAKWYSRWQERYRPGA